MSRDRQVGWGYLVWWLTPDRMDDIAQRRKSATDRVKVFFRFDDGSTATGIHKTLRRSS